MAFRAPTIDDQGALLGATREWLEGLISAAVGDSGDNLEIRGTLGTLDLNDLDRGIWRQAFDANVTSARNYPPAAGSGVLLSVNGDPDNEIRQIYFSARGIWVRSRVAYTWGAWEGLTSDFKYRGLLGSLDLDAATATGFWAQQYSGNALPERHYPAKGAGMLEVYPLAPAGDVRQVWTVTSPWPGSSWHRRLAGGEWSTWEQIGAGGTTPAPVADSVSPGAPGISATRRATRLSMARKRLLGGAGTGGQGAVALRFDDGHADFKAKVLPLLKKHGLPSYIAVTNKLLTESGVTYSELRDWALNAGVEVTSHSRDHTDRTTDADILSAVHTFGDDLEKSVGQIIVDTWTFPGGGDFGGLNAGTYPHLFAETYSGRLLLERYSVVNGGSAGYYQPLTGEPTVGQAHVTMETYTLEQVKGMVAGAQANGMGLSLMMHPAKLDTAGNMTTATLDSVLGWIASEREAGRLVVLTGTGLGFADAGTAQRVNLLAAAAWVGSGWTITNGVASTTSYTTPITASTVINPWAGSRGAPVELITRVQGTAGDVIRVALSAGAMSASRDVTLPRTGWCGLHLPATIPTGTALGSSVTATVTRVSSAGAVTVRPPALHTI